LLCRVTQRMRGMILDDMESFKVFRRIYADRDVVAEVFRQHFEGLGLLDC
jgi:hypothetical protein